MANGSSLSGLRILVVEDEPLIALGLETLLQSYGCQVVGPAFDLPQATGLSREQAIDGALLDVNIAGEKVFPVADILTQRGIPFCFVTGYGAGGLRDCDHGRPMLQKPYTPDSLLKIAQRWRGAIQRSTGPSS